MDAHHQNTSLLEVSQMVAELLLLEREVVILALVSTIQKSQAAS